MAIFRFYDKDGVPAEITRELMIRSDCSRDEAWLALVMAVGQPSSGEWAVGMARRFPPVGDDGVSQAGIIRALGAIRDITDERVKAIQEGNGT
jgi:hypothetical protein